MRTLFCWRKGRAHLIWLAGLQGHGKLVASIFVSRSTSRATRRRRCCCSCIYLFFLSLSASTNHSAAFKRDGKMTFFEFNCVFTPCEVVLFHVSTFLAGWREGVLYYVYYSHTAFQNHCYYDTEACLVIYSRGAIH
jgi:hypothetical protein